MEFYTHQTPQQQQQSGTAALAQQQQHIASTMVDSNNCLQSNSANSSTTVNTTTADAATFAIAKDMLQLHHGSPLNNNNGSSSSSSNGNAVGDILAAAAASSPSSSSNATTPPTAAATIFRHNHNNNSSNASSNLPAPPPPDTALGFLKYEQELLYICEPTTIIGRNSSTSHVHFHVAENNLVSRKHFQVLYVAETRDFYVQCLSKNGIFVDEFLQRRNAEPLKLPESCYFRFPSTEIRIQFESFAHGAGGDSGSTHTTGGAALSSLNNNRNHSPQSGVLGGAGNSHVIISPAPPDDHYQHQPSQHHPHHHNHQQQHLSTSSSASSASHLMPSDNSNVIYSPLKISIPKKEQKSPYLSPTGTISAANSCPASPRQGFHQNQANYNNYNNNLQNQDLFQTPSTASYNHNEKPPYSYAQLIVQAISAAPDKQLTLSGIYSFIVKHYPYYRKETNKGWQNSIRHNLSLNRYFIKVARSQDEPGKGSFWRIDPESGAKLIDHSYKKRRQRSSQGFRPSYGMPRSAPVSPSHMEYFADNSRESSPLQDIVLQSAPGSPGMSLENRAADNEMMYNSQNMHQGASNNSHNQYHNSPYYVSNQNAAMVQQQQQQLHSENSTSGGGGGNNNANSVGALIALKRNHAMAATAAANANAVVQSAHAQQQALHPDIIYEEMPTDYSGNMESSDECGGGGGQSDAAKRPKYISEVL